jgi:hypothetical protein
MARQTSATRMLWQSTYCVVLRRKLTQQSHSRSSSKFLMPEPLQSNYRPHPICPTSTWLRPDKSNRLCLYNRTLCGATPKVSPDSSVN